MTPIPWLDFLTVCAQLILFALALAIAFFLLAAVALNVYASWRQIGAAAPGAVPPVPPVSE